MIKRAVAMPRRVRACNSGEHAVSRRQVGERLIFQQRQELRWQPASIRDAPCRLRPAPLLLQGASQMRSPTLAPKAIEVGKPVTRQFIQVAFAGLPSSTQVPLKRATALVRGVQLRVLRQMHGPSTFSGTAQCRIVFHVHPSKIAFRINARTNEKLPLFPGTRSSAGGTSWNHLR